MRIPAKKALSIVLSILLLVSYLEFTPQANAALITNSSVQLSDPRPSQSSVTYTVTYQNSSANAIQCIQAKFGTTSALSSAPTGMTSASGKTVSGGTLTNGNWTNYGSTNGTLEVYYATGETPDTSAITIAWTGVTNTSTPGPLYVQITTYSTESSSGTTCSGVVDQSNIMAITTTGGVATSVTVDPTISFSVTGYNGSGINGGPATDLITTASSMAFGSVSAGGSATSAAQLLTLSTNAAHGYTIYIRYTQALTDANTDTIRDQSGSPSSPNSFDGSNSQSSFAYTTDSSTVAMGSNNWAGLTTTNTSIDAQTSPQNAATMHVEYQLQLKNTQQPGTYSNVITYTATPTY